MKYVAVQFSVVGLLSTASFAQVDLIRYVDDSATSGGDGLTWATAYDTIQEGIDDVETVLGSFNRRIVVVAEGTYNPTDSFWPPSSIDLRDRSIVIDGLESIEIRGGFLGGDRRDES